MYSVGATDQNLQLNNISSISEENKTPDMNLLVSNFVYFSSIIEEKKRALEISPEEKEPVAKKRALEISSEKRVREKAQNACIRALTKGCIAKPNQKKGPIYLQEYTLLQKEILKLIPRTELKKIRVENCLIKYIDQKTNSLNQANKLFIDSDSFYKNELKQKLQISSIESTFPYGELVDWKIPSYVNVSISLSHASMNHRIREIAAKLKEKQTIEAHRDRESTARIIMQLN